MRILAGCVTSISRSHCYFLYRLVSRNVSSVQVAFMAEFFLFNSRLPGSNGILYNHFLPESGSFPPTCCILYTRMHACSIIELQLYFSVQVFILICMTILHQCFAVLLGYLAYKMSCLNNPDTLTFGRSVQIGNNSRIIGHADKSW